MHITTQSLPCPLSPLGFGAYQIGRVAGEKYASAGAPLPSEEDAGELLNQVLDLGVTLIDTAPAYGLSEGRIGKYLRDRRSEYNLCSKVGELIENNKSVFDFTPEGMRTSLESSLKTLQTDCLDILLIHAPPNDLAVLHETDAVEQMIRFKNEGKTRLIGFSGKTEQAQQEAITWSDVLMVEYSKANQTFGTLISEAHESGKIILIKKAMDSGHLEGNAAIEFIVEDSPVNNAIDCTVIGSAKLSSMQLNASLFMSKGS